MVNLSNFQIVRTYSVFVWSSLQERLAPLCELGVAGSAQGQPWRSACCSGRCPCPGRRVGTGWCLRSLQLKPFCVLCFNYQEREFGLHRQYFLGRDASWRLKLQNFLFFDFYPSEVKITLRIAWIATFQVQSVAFYQGLLFERTSQFTWTLRNYLEGLGLDL